MVEDAWEYVIIMAGQLGTLHGRKHEAHDSDFILTELRLMVGDGEPLSAELKAAATDTYKKAYSAAENAPAPLAPQMAQVEHSAPLAGFLAGLATDLGLGTSDSDQSTKHPDCPYPAGSLECNNASGPLCQKCDWWLDQDDPEDA